MNRKNHELNLDGIVGPSHNYSGLAYGNVASIKNQQMVSNPKAAALQGLAKMKFLADLGVYQAVTPPQERPHVATLRALGFNGSDKEVLESAFAQNPSLFYACSSASSMWMANSATVSPSIDSADGLVHFTPANLSNKFHRSIEEPMTAAFLKRIFYDVHHFVHHPPLPSSNAFADEGAANHSRFCECFESKGLQLFAFGRYGLDEGISTTRYPPRQTFEASQAISRLHQLDPETVVFAKQSPLAIDAGVFHNDVISVSHQNLFLYHQNAFENTPKVIEELHNKFFKLCQQELILVPVNEEQVSLQQAVESYLFNSQIVTLRNDAVVLIAPSECQEIAPVKAFLDHLVSSTATPIQTVHYFNLRESMLNGGGPACLRLRVVLTAKELRAMHPRVLLNNELYSKLVAWIESNYRDRLLPQDLVDIQFLDQERKALDDLTQILSLGSIYSFQN